MIENEMSSSTQALGAREPTILAASGVDRIVATRARMIHARDPRGLFQKMRIPLFGGDHVNHRIELLRKAGVVLLRVFGNSIVLELVQWTAILMAGFPVFHHPEPGILV